MCRTLSNRSEWKAQVCVGGGEGVRGRQGVWLGHTCPSWPQGLAGSQYNFTEVAA